jgi:hypothetical protein
MSAREKTNLRKHIRGGPEGQPKGRDKRPWWLDPAFIIGIALFLFGGPLNYFSTNPRILYLGVVGLSVLMFYGVHQYIASIEQRVETPPPAPQPEVATDPIVVRPSEPFMLIGGGWINKTSITVTNTGSVPLYSVFIKVWADNPDFKSEQIQIDADQKEIAPGGKAGPVEFQGDVLMWDWLDSSKVESVLIRFYVIMPGETRACNVSGRAVAGGTQGPVNGRVKLLGHKTQPDPIQQSEGKLAFMFQPPENGTLKGFRVKARNPGK